MEESFGVNKNQIHGKKKILGTNISTMMWMIITVLCIAFLEMLRHLGIRLANLTGIFAIPVLVTSLKNGRTSGIINASLGVAYTYYYLFIVHRSPQGRGFMITYLALHSIILYLIPMIIGELKKKLIDSARELITSQEQLAVTKEFSIVMVTYSDLEGRIIKVPDRFCKLLGYTEEELLKMKYEEITHPLDREKEKRKMQDTIKNKYKSFEMEKRLIKKDGEIIWVYINISLAYDENGNPVGFMAYSKDINSYKKTVIKLKESEEKLRKIADHMIDMICQVDEHGVFQYLSPSCQKVMGYLPEELLYTSIFNKLHPDDLDYGKEVFYETIKNNGTKKAELRMMYKNGEYTWLEVVGGVFYDAQGIKKGAVFSGREITARKIAEKALIESEKNYRLLTENSPYAIVVHQEEKIVYANKYAVHIIGCKNAEELVGRYVWEFIHKDFKQSVKPKMEKGYAGFDIPLAEEKLIKLNGEMLDVEIMGIPFECKGNPAIQTIIKDITDRKRAERLQQNILAKQQELEKAQEYDKLKTEFFANISHELRTPLNVILGTLQLLKLYMQDEYLLSKNPKIVKHTNIMKQNCLRLLRLVNNIIDSTKIDSGFYELQLQDYDIIEMVENITKSVASYIESKNINLILSSSISQLIIAVDSDKIERVLLNLLSNAVKFTPEGGKIQVDISKYDNKVQITVSDTGIGIPKEKVGELFQRFHQVDKSLTRNHEGSGIGLSLVHSLVSMHGGKVMVDSEYDKGSKFSIVLPIRRVYDHGPVKKDHIEHSARIERIRVEFSDIYS